MKNLKTLMALLLGAMLLTFASCDDDDGDKGFGKPKYGNDFTVVVDGNDVTLACTMEGATSVIWEVNGKEYTDLTKEIMIPVMGDYDVVLNVSEDGLIYFASEPYTISIASTDLTFMQSGPWKYLTGGNAGYNKTWVLDLESKYFHATADYYGDGEAGAIGKDAWGPWGGGYVSTYDLGGAITFDGSTGNVKLTFNGVTTEGSFGFDVIDRPAYDTYLTFDTSTEYDLWTSGFVSGPYSYLPFDEAVMGRMQFESGFYFPLDSNRFYNNAAAGENTVNLSQFKMEDLENVDIVHIADSSMVVRVKRSFEKDDENKCWMLYNYIVKEYDYPAKEVVVQTPAIVTGFDATTLVGTWNFAAGQTLGWVSWESDDLYDAWDTRDAMMTALTSWWKFGDPGVEASATVAAAKNTAANKVTVTFEANGNCAIHNVIYNTDTSAEEASDVSTTYTVSEGVITFGADVKITAQCVDLTGTELHVLAPAKGGSGLWVGHQDGDSEQSVVIQLEKQ